MGVYQCQVLEQIQITENSYRLILKANEIAQDCDPGQFVYMRVVKGIDPLLRRPFSIHRVDREKGKIELLYRVIGQGTEIVRNARPGYLFQLMGPLGRGFSLEGSYSTAVIVAGGIGVAPAFFLIDKLLALKKRIVFYWGVKIGSEIFGIRELERSGIELHLATEDGSIGYHGLITDLLQKFLDSRSADFSLIGFVCGPKKMLKEVKRIAAQTSFHWQVSLEERMACGVGVCQGCAVKLKNGNYSMVCSDGPVFDLGAVEFDG